MDLSLFSKNPVEGLNNVTLVGKTRDYFVW